MMKLNDDGEALVMVIRLDNGKRNGYSNTNRI